jgi:two-component system response regulator AlgR
MKILIVDDEQPARDRLRHLLAEEREHNVLGEAKNGREALRKIAELHPDVVLLDIRMPGLSGLETARHIHAFDNPPAVIFTTAYDEYAVEAFEARAIGYVLKPVRRERLEVALAQARRLGAGALRDLELDSGSTQARSHVCAKLGNDLKLIPVDDVLYFQADQKYVRACHTAGNDLIDDSLKYLETEFDDRFVRIHRSVLVSIAHIGALEKTSEGQIRVRLRDHDSDEHGALLISRRHIADVRRRLKGS